MDSLELSGDASGCTRPRGVRREFGGLRQLLGIV